MPDHGWEGGKGVRIRSESESMLVNKFNCSEDVVNNNKTLANKFYIFVNVLSESNLLGINFHF
jgi:hypothetical protein